MSPSVCCGLHTPVGKPLGFKAPCLRAADIFGFHWEWGQLLSEGVSVSGLPPSPAHSVLCAGSGSMMQCWRFDRCSVGGLCATWIHCRTVCVVQSESSAIKRTVITSAPWRGGMRGGLGERRRSNWRVTTVNYVSVCGCGCAHITAGQRHGERFLQSGYTRAGCPRLYASHLDPFLHGTAVTVITFHSRCRILMIGFVLKYLSIHFAGYFSQISTLADVQENVMRYLHVMSRPKVIDHEHDTVWTEAYVDSAVSITAPHWIPVVACFVSTHSEYTFVNNWNCMFVCAVQQHVFYGGWTA